jgi:hypothetical protein
MSPLPASEEFAAAVRSGATMSDADTVAHVRSEIDRLLIEHGRRHTLPTESRVAGSASVTVMVSRPSPG